MPLLQQVIQLLSESPGNIVYHLVTLFALQAVFAISLGHWRHHRADTAVQRMMWASGAIFTARFILMIISLLLQSDTAAATVLPLLEQFVHTITAVFLVWALTPHSTRWPHLGNTVLIITLIFTLVITLFFAQEWQLLAAEGLLYGSTRQATFIGLFQILILGTGLLLTLTTFTWRRSLHPIVMGLLLLAHILQVIISPEILTIDTHIAYWLRLGHLIVFPLWVALVYRHVITALLATKATSQPPLQQLNKSWQLAAQVIDDLTFDKTIQAAIYMVSRLVNASFIGIAMVTEEDTQQLHLVSNLPQPNQDQPQSWHLHLADWSAFRLVLEQKEALTLSPDGLGARQIYHLYETLGLSARTLAPLYIEPLQANGTAFGLLLITQSREHPAWTEADKALIQAIVPYIAQAIHNSQLYTQTRRQIAATPVLTTTEPIGTGRLIALETENQRLVGELETTTDRLYQAETRAAAAHQRARDLVATIEEIERLNRDEHIESLEAEIELLRESLIEAEEAMAMASAADSGLSTEWVMQAITRYSGQLEDAQSRIKRLETALQKRDGDSSQYEVILSLVQELRTPMTSIAGYADLLLSETAGLLTAKQSEFLQRVRANIERLGSLLDQLIQLTAGAGEEPVLPDREPVDVREVIETAVHNVITQMQEKNLRLDLDIAENLQPLAIDREAFQQIMVNLLQNACQSSPKNGRIAINASTHNIVTKVDDRPIRFIHLTIQDSGQGIHLEDRKRVFNPQYRADDPLIEGLGETDAGLAVARTLTQAYGGRIWIDSDVGQGSTFSVVFPIQAANGKQ